MRYAELRTVVLVHVLWIRELAVPEVEPLGRRHRNLEVLVFLVRSKSGISMCEREARGASGFEDYDIPRGP